MTKLEEKKATSSTESGSDYHVMKREQSASDCSSSSGSDSRRQARILRGVANPSVGLFESSMGLGDWLKKLDNLPKLKTPMKDIAKILEFQFSFKILMKAEGLQEEVQKKYLLWAVFGTTKSDFVQSDTSDWTVNQMFKFLKKLNLGANFSQKVEKLLDSVVQEELECIKKFAKQLSWFLLELQLDLNSKEAKLKL